MKAARSRKREAPCPFLQMLHVGAAILVQILQPFPCFVRGHFSAGASPRGVPGRGGLRIEILWFGLVVERDLTKNLLKDVTLAGAEAQIEHVFGPGGAHHSACSMVTL